MAEAVAMATGRALLGIKPARPLTVWYWNGEDPFDEIERRFAAILVHYDIDPADVEGRLFFGSGRDTPIIMAVMTSNGAQIAEPLADEVEREMRDLSIDCLILDPFVSTHGVPENDNGAIDLVAKRWAKVADRTNACIELIHHVRKSPSGVSAELTIDDARGAVSLIGATRSMRVLNPMTKEEADKTGVSQDRRRLHFRIDSANGKANMAPPLEHATWFQLVGVPLGNATDQDPEDHVGVVTSWSVPNALDDVTADDLRAVQQAVSAGKWRADPQAKAWVGGAVAEVLDLDVADQAVKQKIKILLAVWTKNGMFREVEMIDEKRKPRRFIEVAQWAV